MVKFKGSLFASRYTLCLLIVTGLGGCSSLLGLKASEQTFLSLPDENVSESTQSAPSSKHLDLNLLVREAQGSEFIDSHRIAFSRDNFEQGYYQQASWTESPTKRFTDLLIARLDHSQLFNSVSRTANSVLGQLQLNTEITQFYHNIHREPGTVEVRINAELIDLSNRLIVSKRSFYRSVPAASYTARGAAEGFAVALTQIIDELVGWLADSSLAADEHAGVSSAAPSELKNKSGT